MVNLSFDPGKFWTNIGIEISRQLAERGLRPRLLVRRPVRRLMLRNLDAENMQAELLIEELEAINFAFIECVYYKKQNPSES